jgi:hypothetical protein
LFFASLQAQLWLALVLLPQMTETLVPFAET